MRVVAVIPARMGSSRFPGKPLCKILGKTMIEHVYKRSAMAKTLNDIVVATCDREIYEEVKRFGGKAVMTSDTHERCTDRIAEAISNIDADIVVNIQGDEPMVSPDMIDDVVKVMLADPKINCANLMAPIKTKEEQADPNEVKVVFDLNKWALYFSREAIPSWKKGAKQLPMYKQVCIIPFRRDFLMKFNDLPQTQLEIAESVDMMRVLEHGYKVKMVVCNQTTYSVDTEDDRIVVENALKNDPLIGKY